MKKFITLAAGCCILLACNNQSAEQSAKKDSATTTVETKSETPKDAEFADPKYADIGKAALAALTKGDIDAFVAGYADNAVYQWSSGDSLAGLPAIKKYWSDRRSTVIDSISFANDIWLSIKVNKSQRGPDVPGIWLMGWYQFNTKYKNGKRVAGWIHHDMHFNDAGKIDRSIQYIDRAPINAALGKK